MKKIFFLIIFITNSIFADLNISLGMPEFEPSGIDINDRGELVVVSDEGSVLLIDRQGNATRAYFEDRDIEGVSFNKDFSKIYIADEATDNILEITMDEEIVHEYNIKRKFNGKKVLKKGGDGIEGLTFFKETEKSTFFYISNQSDNLEGIDRSSIMLVELNKKTEKGKIIEYYPIDIPDISGLFYDDTQKKIYFISDTTNKLYLTDTRLNIIDSIDLIADAQEGITIDFEERYLYIADDEGDIFMQKI